MMGHNLAEIRASGNVAGSGQTSMSALFLLAHFARRLSRSYRSRMFAPGSPKIPRRRRLGAAFVLVGLFTYTGAGAQSDKDWVETALERTLRLSAPWKLPSSPQLDRPSSPNEVIAPEVSPELDLVLEVPWGTNETGSNEPTVEPLVVKSVDRFDDPWDRDVGETQTGARPSVPESTPYQDSMLIDPWAD